MEDDGRPVLGEDLAHPLALLAVGEHDGQRRGVDVAVVLQLALDAEEVVLGVVEQDQLARRDAGDLAAELGADRAAGAGDHHDLALAGSARRGRAPSAPARGRGCPRPRPGAPGARRCRPPVCSSSKTVGSVRTGMPRARQARHDAGAQRARRRRDRDRDLVGLGLVEDPWPARRCGPARARRRCACGAWSGRRRRSRPGSGRGPGCARSRAGPGGRRRRRRRSARGARRLAGRKPLQRALVDRARDEARAADEDAASAGRTGRGRRSGSLSVTSPRPDADDDRVRQRDEGRDEERRDDDGLHDAEVVALADVAPPLLVEPEEREDQQRRRDDVGQRRAPAGRA